MPRMGSSNSAAAKRMIKNIDICPITERGINIADQIYGPSSVEALQGITKKMRSPAAAIQLGPRMIQVQQSGSIDIFFIKPLDMCFVQSLDSQDLLPTARRSKSRASKVLLNMLSNLKSRNFQVSVISCDGEKAVSAMIPELNDHGIVVLIVGANCHVLEVERKTKFIKERRR